MDVGYHENGKELGYNLPSDYLFDKSTILSLCLTLCLFLPPSEPLSLSLSLSLPECLSLSLWIGKMTFLHISYVHIICAYMEVKTDFIILL